MAKQKSTALISEKKKKKWGADDKSTLTSSFNKFWILDQI